MIERFAGALVLLMRELTGTLDEGDTWKKGGVAAISVKGILPVVLRLGAHYASRF